MTRLTSSPAANESAAGRLLLFNQQLLEQAMDVARAHEHLSAPAYATLAGPHLRHVIEHYEALLVVPVPTMADYDLRPRDRDVEQFAHIARQRLQALCDKLDALISGSSSVHAESGADALLQHPLRVRGVAGMAGEFEFVTDSTLGRELAFLASHTVHHFALLRSYCAQHGIFVADNFGVAPATIAHARQTSAPPRVALHEEARGAHVATLLQSAA